MANKEVDIIEGEVTQAYAPSKNEEGRWRPANIIIQRDDGSQATIKQFPKSDYDTRVTYEPIQMPPWYEALDFDNLIGSWVQVAAVHNGEYNGIAQYDSVKTFKVASAGSPLKAPQPRTAQPQTAKPSTAEMPSFVDEPAEQAEYDEQPDEQQAAEGAVFDLFGNADDGVLPIE